MADQKKKKPLVLYFYDELSEQSKRYAYAEYVLDGKDGEKSLDQFLMLCRDHEYTFMKDGKLTM